MGAQGADLCPLRVNFLVVLGGPWVYRLGPRYSLERSPVVEGSRLESMHMVRRPDLGRSSIAFSSLRTDIHDVIMGTDNFTTLRLVTRAAHAFQIS